jgi:hypothetical protein
MGGGHRLRDGHGDTDDGYGRWRMDDGRSDGGGHVNGHGHHLSPHSSTIDATDRATAMNTDADIATARSTRRIRY